MNNIDLTKPHRQSPKGLLLILTMSIQKSVRALWPFILIYFFKNQALEGHQAKINLAFVIVSVLFIVHAILYYLNFKFHVQGENFILKKGYLRKQELNIPFERIQSVNYKANVLQRLLNVVSLEIDTAGSVKAELKILALELNFAEALKDILSNSSNSVEKETISHDLHAENKPSIKILKINLAELIKIGLLQNHLQMAAIIMAFGWQFYHELAENFKEEVNELSGQVNEQILQSSLIILISMGLLFLTISVAASVIRVIIRFFEFEFSKSENAFQMQAGLLNRKNMIIPFKKIQELSWETNPLKKAFKLFSVKIKQANSQIDKKKSSMEIPGCQLKSLVHLKQIVFGENEFVSDRRYSISKKFFWRILFFMGCVPIIASSALYIFKLVPYWVPILWFVFSIFSSWLAIQKRYIQVSENQLIVSKGMFGQDWKQLEMYKIQVIDLTQSIFQKSSGLASINIYTASGRTSIPFIDENLAKELQKYLIYKIQSAEKSWM